MKKTLTMLATLAAMAMMQAALSQDAAEDLEMPVPVQLIGEKLDSGLGTMVYGESLDSGLGTMIYGESLDSGLGELTPLDMQRYFPAPAVRTAEAR